MIHQEINKIYGESDGGGGCGSPRARRRSSVLLSLLTMSRVFTVLKAVCLTPDTNGRSLISCQKPKTGSDIRSSRSLREFRGGPGAPSASQKRTDAPLYEESDPLVGPGRRVFRPPFTVPGSGL